MRAGALGEPLGDGQAAAAGRVLPMMMARVGMRSRSSYQEPTDRAQPRCRRISRTPSAWCHAGVEDPGDVLALRAASATAMSSTRAERARRSRPEEMATALPRARRRRRGQRAARVSEPASSVQTRRGSRRQLPMAPPVLDRRAAGRASPGRRARPRRARSSPRPRLRSRHELRGARAEPDGELTHDDGGDPRPRGRGRQCGGNGGTSLCVESRIRREGAPSALSSRNAPPRTLDDPYRARHRRSGRAAPSAR